MQDVSGKDPTFIVSSILVVLCESEKLKEGSHCCFGLDRQYQRDHDSHLCYLISANFFLKNVVTSTEDCQDDDQSNPLEMEVKSNIYQIPW